MDKPSWLTNNIEWWPGLEDPMAVSLKVTIREAHKMDLSWSRRSLRCSAKQFWRWASQGEYTFVLAVRNNRHPVVALVCRHDAIENEIVRLYATPTWRKILPRLLTIARLNLPEHPTVTKVKAEGEEEKEEILRGLGFRPDPGARDSDEFRKFRLPVVVRLQDRPPAEEADSARDGP